MALGDCFDADKLCVCFDVMRCALAGAVKNISKTRLSVQAQRRGKGNRHDNIFKGKIIFLKLFNLFKATYFRLKVLVLTVFVFVVFMRSHVGSFKFI